MLSSIPSAYRNRVLQEVETIPEEYLVPLLKMIQVFRESVTLKSAEESFRQGWQEAQRDETLPVSALWDNIDAE